MKKIISLVTVFTLLFCLTGCSSNKNSKEDVTSSSPVNSENESSQNTEKETTTGSDESQAPDVPQESASGIDGEEPDGTGTKALVVYFSHSGNTKSVAMEIQKQTGADIFEIVPKTSYTTDYNEMLDVAQNEKRNSARPEISDTVKNLEKYDVIYLGFPNWWADMPMVLYTFLDTYDLSGKTIAPFVTSGGSGFSNTISTIKSMEPDADVADGLAIRDSASDNPADAVAKWLEKLN